MPTSLVIQYLIHHYKHLLNILSDPVLGLGM